MGAIQISNLTVNSNGCVGINSRSPSYKLHITGETMGVLYYIDASRCNISKSIEHSRLDGPGSEVYFIPMPQTHRLTIETELHHQLHSTSFQYYHGVTGLMIKYPSSIDGVRIEYANTYLQSVESTDGRKQKMVFLVNQGSTDKSIFPLDEIEHCRILTRCDSNKKVEKIYREILTEFFELPYGPLMLAHPNALVRDIARNIEKLEKMEYRRRP